MKKLRRVCEIGLMATVLVALLAPQVQAVSWKTYKDPEGRFSMEYPANWQKFEIANVVSFSDPDRGIGCIVTAGYDVGQFGDQRGIVSDSEMTEEGMTIRMVMICGESCIVVFAFSAPEGEFDSANRDYFNEMIKRVDL